MKRICFAKTKARTKKKKIMLQYGKIRVVMEIYFCTGLLDVQCSSAFPNDMKRWQGIILARS